MTSFGNKKLIIEFCENDIADIFLGKDYIVTAISVDQILTIMDYYKNKNYKFFDRMINSFKKIKINKKAIKEMEDKMAVNKRQYDFNKKKDKIIFNTPIDYTEGHIKEILSKCGMTVTFIKNNKGHYCDEILFRDENFIYYTLVQDAPELCKNMFHISLWSKNINIPNKTLGQIKGITELNIKKLTKKIKPEKYIDYISVKDLLKEYKKLVNTIEESHKIFEGVSVVNEVLPQNEIDRLLSNISSH